MRVRCELLTARRQRLLQLLHGLWTVLATLGEVTPGEAAGELARLEAIRTELDRELAALHDEAPREG